MMHLKGYFSSRRRAAFSPLCITTIMAARRPSRILKPLPTSWLLSHCASSPKISIPSCAKKTLLLMQPTLIFPMVLMGAMVLLWRTEKKETICRWASAMLVASFFTLMTYFGDTTKFLMLKSWCYVIWVWMGLSGTTHWWRWCIYGQKWVDGWLNLAALLPLMMMIMPVSNVLHWRRRKIKVMVHCWCPKFKLQDLGTCKGQNCCEAFTSTDFNCSTKIKKVIIKDDFGNVVN